MTRQEVSIQNKLGLHARASTKLTQTASQYKSDVWLSRNERKVNAKSIMGVMMLAAAKGTVITVEANGEDELRAVEAICALVDDKFGEGE